LRVCDSHLTPKGTTSSFVVVVLATVANFCIKSSLKMFGPLFLYFAFLLVFSHAATSTSSVEDSSPGSNGNFSTESVGRSLQWIVPCIGPGGKQVFFNIEIQVIQQGGFTPYNCTSASYQQFGLEINAILDDLGVGVAGVGDNAAFLARVCPEPIVHQRRLAAKGFIWMGGGACRYCQGDNFDKRRLQLNDPNWFRNIYAPELENKLRNTIVERVKKYKNCFGNGPQVLVDVTQVSKDQVMDGCITP
jgi:hypothetical protein